MGGLNQSRSDPKAQPRLRINPIPKRDGQAPILYNCMKDRYISYFWNLNLYLDMQTVSWAEGRKTPGQELDEMDNTWIGCARNVILMPDTDPLRVRTRRTSVDGTIYANSEFEGCECFQRRPAIDLPITEFSMNEHVLPEI